MSVRKAKIKVLFACLTGLFCLVRGQDSLAPWLKRLDARMLNQEYYRGFSGVVLVGMGDSIIFNHAYGLAEDKNSVPMGTDHKFMIASLSKAYTATAVMMLVDEGKLKLNDRVGKYIQELRGQQKDKITIHQLLNHTSGIPDYINDFPLLFRLKSWLGWRPAHSVLLQFITEKSLEFKPGSQFNYSNSGYFLLAEIVERVTGDKFESFVEKRILKPLNLKHSGFEFFDEVESAATGYDGKFYHRKAVKNLHPNLIFGMGGMYSTTEDIFHWVRGMTSGKLLSDSLSKEMFDPGYFRYGYGWDVGYQYGERTYSHGGYLPGWNSQILHLTESGLTCVVMSNYDDVDPLQLTELVARLWYNHNENEAISATNDSLPEQWEGRYMRTGEPFSVNVGSFPDPLVMVRKAGNSLILKLPEGQLFTLELNSASHWVDESGKMEIHFSGDSEKPLMNIEEDGKSTIWKKM